MRIRESLKADCASNSDQDNFILGDGKVGNGPTEYSPGLRSKTSEEASNTQRNWSCEPREKQPFNIHRIFPRHFLRVHSYIYNKRKEATKDLVGGRGVG
jgi:hypothetical protein